MDGPLQLANPYAPPPDLAELPAETPPRGAELQRRSWAKSLLIWTVVCAISAAPSFFWGLGTIASHQAAAMALGIIIFIAAYTLGDQATQRTAWRRDAAVRLSLKIGYVTRLAVSVIFPIGGFIDLFCGLFSMSVVELFLSSEFIHSAGNSGVAWPPHASFVSTLTITLVQGVVLNAALSAYMLVVFAVVLLVQRGHK